VSFELCIIYVIDESESTKVPNYIIIFCTFRVIRLQFYLFFVSLTMYETKIINTFTSRNAVHYIYLFFAFYFVNEYKDIIAYNLLLKFYFLIATLDVGGFKSEIL
jgi:hypothetical protein